MKTLALFGMLLVSTICCKSQTYDTAHVVITSTTTNGKSYTAINCEVDTVINGNIRVPINRHAHKEYKHGMTAIQSKDSIAYYVRNKWTPNKAR